MDDGLGTKDQAVPPDGQGRHGMPGRIDGRHGVAAAG